MPILATLNSSTKSFRTSQRNLPPSMCWKLKYQFSMGKVHTCILLSILNPLGFLPGEFWWRMLDFREKGMVFAEEVGPVCFIVSTDKSWLQLFFPTYDVTWQVLILPSLGGVMRNREILHQPVLCCATPKHWCEYSKKDYEMEIHGCKIYLPVAFHCAWHIWFFRIFPLAPSYTSSFSWVHTLQYHFRRTWFMKIPLRVPCLRLERGGKCQKHCQRCLIFPGRLAANI